MNKRFRKWIEDAMEGANVSSNENHSQKDFIDGLPSLIMGANRLDRKLLKNVQYNLKSKDTKENKRRSS